MTRNSGEGPRQSAGAFKDKDSDLDKVAGTVVSQLPCDNGWKLRVQAKGEANPRKSALDMASVEIEWSDRSLDAPVCRNTAADTVLTDTLADKGARNGNCRAKAPGWYQVADMPVSVNDGDDKTVDLLLKPAVWVAVKVVDHRSTALLADLHIKASLPVLGEVRADTLDSTPVDIEHEQLRPGMTCTLIELTHDDIAYEVVGAVTSA